MRNLTVTVGLLLTLTFLAGSPVQATHELPAPTAWWELDETMAGPVVDSAGSNDGTNNGATIGVPGKFGTAYDFDGVDDRIQIPDAADLDFTGTMTLSGWIKPDTITGDHVLISKERQYYLLTTGANVRIIFVQCPNLLAFETSIPTITIGSFVHLAATANGINDVRLYINGEEVATTVVAGTFVCDLTMDTFIGDSPDFAGQEFNGVIDDVRLYQQALTASQIEDLFLDPGHHACSDQGAVDAQTGFLSNLMPLVIIMFILTVVAVRVPIPRLK